MREDSHTSQGARNHLHWHDGGTCHGYPTMQECIGNAIANGWIGRVLERVDVRHGQEVRCYSFIVSSFDHWGKFGKFVAETKITAELI